MWGTGYWGWGWWFGVFWIVIIVLAVWLIPWGGSRRIRPPEEQILRERYARGEITKEEFDQKLRDLRRAA